MNGAALTIQNEAVNVLIPEGAGPVVVVCEHACNAIPEDFAGLGVVESVRRSHVAWDPGALPVAQSLAAKLNAALIHGAASRLLFDCNRPSDALDAIPEKSEIYDIPGNQALSDAQRAERVTRFHDPFRDALVGLLDRHIPQVLITIHSFTPVYFDRMRDVEIGVLHDTDSRFADVMINKAKGHTQMDVRRNDPYGPEHGVTHTLKTHAIPRGILNVMLEIRNDLIPDPESQQAMAGMLALWMADTMADFGITSPQSETPCQD
ncbi:putative N-formylglutamate amidohydrolase [Thalassovita gelatinovora]|uniref:Putative N-formylglutamate amidohydrolase n=1 Tax=Thalassovita gelatinovora TaxID=53501 RepID=A0A0P1F8Y7_THAGE|nr:N-formylglutamate amidohydrolase [Thalassovita gelatinovora]QIZ81276.1 N-formylglutamate amidohydrolase [Thalassovita gelatinovora]CUH64587.1 putative N-formylglutamate amidohydrolase [Thalassovita gelatinovora]SEP95531.1 Predicted N-formylglutamate amidohydrolase [Thalassovita gelatinovora]